VLIQHQSFFYKRFTPTDFSKSKIRLLTAETTRFFSSAALLDFDV
jgi:hypothetical protein